MAYEIEDIDWSKIPVGAVEFSLEDDDYFLTWYDSDGGSWNNQESKWHVEHKTVIRRKRHKVSDYHPSANRKPTREERLDKALRALVQTHFFGDGLEWNWVEGKSLEDMDPSLHKGIVDLLKNEEKRGRMSMITTIDFRETKIKIISEEQSKAFQEAVFTAGGKWCDGGEFYRRGVKFIFVNGSLSMTLSDREDLFQEHDYKEIQFPTIATKVHIQAEPTPDVAKLVEALESILEMQERNYGDATSTHIELICLANLARGALTAYRKQGCEI